MSQTLTFEPSEPFWPTNCAEAQALVFRLRRRGLASLPGVTADVHASSILNWASNGRGRRCVGVTEVTA